MGAALFAVVVLAALLVRPIAVRLWLAGRISDRTLFVASVARFPALILTFGLLLRVPIPLLVVLTLISLVPGLLMSRVIRDVIHEQSPHR